MKPRRGEESLQDLQVLRLCSLSPAWPSSSARQLRNGSNDATGGQTFGCVSIAFDVKTRGGHR